MEAKKEEESVRGSDGDFAVLCAFWGDEIF